MFTICPKRESLLKHEGHALIEGGPGSGKTTIALLKAMQLIDEDKLLRNQKIIFLSFARASVLRIEEQAKDLIKSEHRKNIEINTYHGFAWSIIQTYGYLVCKHKNFKLLTPPNVAIALSNVPENKKTDFLNSLFVEEGMVAFEVFAKTVREILSASSSICEIISTRYPYIIVDEFQDTDDNEWEIIKLLGRNSNIIALADIEQRIYDFRGASITRVPEYKKYFNGLEIDFGKENNRSGETDIAQFGDDILTGANKGKLYNFVKIKMYPYVQDPKVYLLAETIAAIKRQKKAQKNNWSIAILVHSKAMTLVISEYLEKNKIPHDVLIDSEGPHLSASTIAVLLQPDSDEKSSLQKLILNLINHIRGRKSKLSQKDTEIISVLQKIVSGDKITGKNREILKNELVDIVKKRLEMNLSGDPAIDWIAVRNLFQQSTHEVLTNVYSDAKFLKLLRRGAVLREQLSNNWRENGSYTNATQIINDALIQEHFSISGQPFKGVYLMNIHKCKGKEFDEVIIWEEIYKQIIPKDSTDKRVNEARLLFRVAATRSRLLTTIFTPNFSPCPIL